MLGVSYIELVIVPVSHNEFLSKLYDFHDGESGLAGDLETRIHKRTQLLTNLNVEYYYVAVGTYY